VVELLQILLLGVVVSLLSVFLGFGGGTILVPLLPIFLGLSVKEAIATSSFVVLMNAFLNSVSFARQGLIDWRLIRLFALPALLGAVLASLWIISSAEHVTALLVAVIFVFLVWITYLGPSKAPHFLRRSTAPVLIIAGLSVGAVAGVSGLGGGAFIVPLMIAGAWTVGAKISPTSNAVNFIAGGSSALTFALGSELVHYSTAVSILVVSQMFSYFLRPRQSLLEDQTRRRAVLIYLGLVTLVQLGKAIQLSLGLS
jgi:uncharacterized membrane protein YfcA